MTFLEGLTQTGVFERDGAVAEVAIESLVAEYSALLFRVANAVLRDAAAAEDAVQETFVRVLRHRSSLSEVEDMRVWLVRITWNQALDKRRREKRQQPMDEALAGRLLSGEQPADRRMMLHQQTARVLTEIDRLPAKERQVLLLAATEEMSTTDIAAVVGRSESAVRALLFRARTRLRERLRDKEARR